MAAVYARRLFRQRPPPGPRFNPFSQNRPYTLYRSRAVASLISPLYAALAVERIRRSSAGVS
eukprot:449394-Rhodomonas_salina.3